MLLMMLPVRGLESVIPETFVTAVNDVLKVPVEEQLTPEQLEAVDTSTMSEEAIATRAEEIYRARADRTTRR